MIIIIIIISVLLIFGRVVCELFCVTTNIAGLELLSGL